MPKWLGRLLPNMDIEGEKLREHQDAVAWARGQGAAAISADSLLVGTARASGRAAQPERSRRVHSSSPAASSPTAGSLAATLAGRLEPVSGLRPAGRASAALGGRQGRPARGDGRTRRLRALRHPGHPRRAAHRAAAAHPALVPRVLRAAPGAPARGRGSAAADAGRRLLRVLAPATAAAARARRRARPRRDRRAHARRHARPARPVRLGGRRARLRHRDLHPRRSGHDHRARHPGAAARGCRDRTGGRPVVPIDLYSLSSSREVFDEPAVHEQKGGTCSRSTDRIRASLTRKRWLRWARARRGHARPARVRRAVRRARSSKSDTALDRIPAAIVNQDTLVYTTAADGTKSPGVRRAPAGDRAHRGSRRLRLDHHQREGRQEGARRRLGVRDPHRAQELLQLDPVAQLEGSAAGEARDQDG